MRLYTKLAAVVLCVALSSLSLGGQTPIAPPAPATLGGVVQDSAGLPIADAEIIVRGTGRAARSDATGKFLIADAPPGAYEVWIRRLGYRSALYNWTARVGERTDIVVSLFRVPQKLDPVVVQAQEDKSMGGKSTIVGLVVDSLEQPVDEAEVQLVGANRTGLSRDSGGFAFRGLTPGAYMVRVRKLGYSPNTVAVELVPSEERELMIKIRQLPVGLSPVVVNARSGYAGDQRAWDELEQRKRWRTSSRDIMLGPEELRRFGSMSLDLASRFMGVGGAENFAGMRSRVPDVSPATRGLHGKIPIPTTANGAGDDCILINGRTGRYEPLRLYSASDLEMIEVYPSWSEPSGTVAMRMPPQCKPQYGVLEHPTYYVLWFKGAK